MTENNKRFVIDEFFDNDDVLNSHIYMVDEINGKIYSNSWICFKQVCELCNQLNDENEQLQSQLSGYKEVNRLDIWKSSYSSEDALITELQDKCNKKQEHITLLENKIHRMREDIKRLEALYHYRGYIGSGDVKKEYYRMEKLLKAENNKLKEENKQLKQQIKDLRIDVLDSIHKADEIQCSCNPCVVEECVKRVIE